MAAPVKKRPARELGVPEIQQVDYWRAQAPALARGSYFLRDFNYPFPKALWHQHPEMEVIQFLSGEGSAFVGDTVLEFHPGDIFFLGENLPHGWRRHPEHPGNVHTRVLQFRPSAFGTLFEANPEVSTLHGLCAQAGAGLHVRGGAKTLAADFLANFIHSEPGDPRRVSGLLHLLVEWSLHTGDPTAFAPLSTIPTAKGHPQDPLFAQLLHLMEEKFGDPLHHGDLAERCGFKPAAFSRWFTRRAGQTFERYLLELRLSRGARALIQSEDPVAEIADACGFASLTYFYRAFQKRHGMAPALFRQKSRERMGTEGGLIQEGGDAATPHGQTLERRLGAFKPSVGPRRPVTRSGL